MKFENYLGIDYSGAKGPDDRLQGIRLFLIQGNQAPEEIRPNPDQPKRHWSRTTLRRWLVEFLNAHPSTLIGIDHGLSFPLTYLQARGLSSWSEFLKDFHARWPRLTERTVDSCLATSPLSAPHEASHLLRLTETWIPGPTSVFRTIGQGSVGKSSFSGIAQLSQLIEECDTPIQVWPFDGWVPDPKRPVVAEVYPSLWRRRFTTPADGTTDQRDALAVVKWLHHQAHTKQLAADFQPLLDSAQKAQAEVEGWILGVR